MSSISELSQQFKTQAAELAKTRHALEIAIRYAALDRDATIQDLAEESGLDPRVVRDILTRI